MPSFIFNFVGRNQGEYMRNYLIILFVLGMAGASFAQEPILQKEEIRILYRSEVSGGLFLHSHGFGANFRYSQNLTSKVKRTFSAELLNMKHPKEKKIQNALERDARGYYYGKLNSLTIFRANIGRQKVIFGKELRGGVQVNYLYAAGVTLGFLKPIYLEIKDFSRPNVGTIKVERYDPAKHNQNDIYGRALFTHGLSEISVIPGGHAKLALNFEYAPDDELLKAMEVGMVMDAFYKTPQIMNVAENNQFWLTFYVNLQFGKKIL